MAVQKLSRRFETPTSGRLRARDRGSTSAYCRSADFYPTGPRRIPAPAIGGRAGGEREKAREPGMEGRPPPLRAQRLAGYSTLKRISSTGVVVMKAVLTAFISALAPVPALVQP